MKAPPTEKAPRRSGAGREAEVAEKQRSEDNGPSDEAQGFFAGIPASTEFSAAVHNLLFELERRRMGCLARCRDEHVMLRLLAGPWSPARARQADFFRQQWAKAHAQGETLAELQDRLNSDSVWSLRVEGEEAGDITLDEEDLHRLVHSFSQLLTPAFDE